MQEILTPQENPEETQQPQAVFLNVNCNPTQYIVQQPTLVESQLPPVFILQSEEPTFHTEKKSMAYSYDWTLQLNDPYFSSADVSYFPHVSAKIVLFFFRFEKLVEETKRLVEHEN